MLYVTPERIRYRFLICLKYLQDKDVTIYTGLSAVFFIVQANIIDTSPFHRPLGRGEDSIGKTNAPLGVSARGDASGAVVGKQLFYPLSGLRMWITSVLRALHFAFDDNPTSSV